MVNGTCSWQVQMYPPQQSFRCNTRESNTPCLIRQLGRMHTHEYSKATCLKGYHTTVIEHPPFICGAIQKPIHAVLSSHSVSTAVYLDLTAEMYRPKRLTTKRHKSFQQFPCIINGSTWNRAHSQLSFTVEEV